MTKKVFRIPKPDRPPAEFDLVFQVRRQEKVNAGTEETPNWVTRDVLPEEWDEESRTFHARLNLPAGIGLGLVGDGGDDDAIVKQITAIRKLFEVAVVERDEFFALLDDTRTVVPMGTLAEIGTWLANEAADRPTSGPSPS